MTEITHELRTKWAESCLRINHLNTLVQREISDRRLHRAAELLERARRRAWDLFNDKVTPEGCDEEEASEEAEGAVR